MLALYIVLLWFVCFLVNIFAFKIFIKLKYLTFTQSEVIIFGFIMGPATVLYNLFFSVGFIFTAIISFLFTLINNTKLKLLDKLVNWINK